MPGPLPPAIDLSAEERQALDALARRHTVPQQVAVRARIIQVAAEGRNTCQIARQLGLEADTVWLGLQGVALADLSVEGRLTDAPRPGRPAQIPAEPICQIHRLACEAPGQAGRPISQWSNREIADEIVRRGILPAISPRHAARIVKRGI